MLSLARGKVACGALSVQPSWRLLQSRCSRCLASTHQRPTPVREATRRTTDREPLQRAKANPSATTLPRSKQFPQPQPTVSTSRSSASPTARQPAARQPAAASRTPATDVEVTRQLAAKEHSKQSPTPLERKSEKLAYPERLLIYHAGTGRTIFLSCTKLSGIFLFIFTGVFIAPAYYFSPMEPTYLAFVYLAGSCIPLALMTFTAAPFVTYVHLGLPTWARQSAARLQRYTQSLPSSAEIDVTSLRWIWPRVTRMNASELYFHKGSLTGALTLRREVPKYVQETRKWYAWRPIKKFYVGGKAGTKSAEPWAWQGVLEAIARGFPRSPVERRR